MRIIESYGIKDYNVYVLSNGIFATIDEQGSHPYSLVRHVAFSNVNLERTAAVNQLSREICEFHYPPGEAIQKMKSRQHPSQVKNSYSDTWLPDLAVPRLLPCFLVENIYDCFFFSLFLLELPCSPFCTMPEYGSPPAFFFLYDCRKCSRNGTQHFTLCPACTCHGR